MPIQRGGLGEPYCSESCYNAAGKDIALANLHGYSGPCGFCQSPVHLSPGSGYLAHPFRKIFLYICPGCRSRAETHAANIRECCFCGTSLSINETARESPNTAPTEAHRARAATALEVAPLQLSFERSDYDAVVRIAREVQALIDAFPGSAHEKMKGAGRAARALWKTWRDLLQRPPQLEGADISRLQLTQANLGGAALRGANLAGTRAFFLNLKEANLDGAQISECHWVLPSTEGASFRNCNASNSHLLIHLRGNWDSALFCKSKLELVDVGQDFSAVGADFTDATVISGQMCEKDALQKLQAALSPEQWTQLRKRECYIATVCYGGSDHPDLDVLRNFRDSVLLTSGFGRIVVGWYYALAPELSTRLARHKALTRSIRALVLQPIARCLRHHW